MAKENIMHIWTQQEAVKKMWSFSNKSETNIHHQKWQCFGVSGWTLRKHVFSEDKVGVGTWCWGTVAASSLEAVRTPASSWPFMQEAELEHSQWSFLPILLQVFATKKFHWTYLRLFTSSLLSLRLKYFKDCKSSQMG